MAEQIINSSILILGILKFIQIFIPRREQSLFPLKGTTGKFG